ncbi:MAG TPA: MarR family transcriptional regulator [Gemmatimonadales bacterium]
MASVASTAERLHSAAIHLLRRLRREDARLDAPVGPAGLSVLSVLVFGGPRTVGELARAEQVKLPTMSRLVTSLERSGMVTRASDPDDRRTVVVRPTSTGRSVMRRGRERRVQALVELLRVLPAHQRKELGRAAELIENLLQRPRPAPARSR